MSVRDQIIVLTCAYNATVVGPHRPPLRVSYPSKPFLRSFLSPPIVPEEKQRRREIERKREKKEVKDDRKSSPLPWWSEVSRSLPVGSRVRSPEDREEKQTRISSEGEREKAEERIACIYER